MNAGSIDAILEEFLASGVETYLPHVSVNCVVLGYRHPHLQFLVHRLPGSESWLIPGGYVKKRESLDEAAYRSLKPSGTEEVFLRQIRTFGEVQRVSGITIYEEGYPDKYEKIMEWIRQRFVTVVYYGLVNLSSTNISPGEYLKDFQWLDVDHPDRMGMDHENIIMETRKILASELLHHPVASRLLAETFTLNELRGLYEAILNRSIDRGTFRRKMLKLGIVEQVDMRKDSIGRPSILFRFNHDAYLRFLAEETRFGF